MTKPSALALLDAIVPKDFGSRRVAADLPYGPHARHRLDLYAPRWGKGPWPVLLFLYGGGWESGRRQEYSFAGRALAAQGFLTAVADYRVAPEVTFPGFVEDAGLAATWLLEHAQDHRGNPEKLVLAGHSAGAYNAVTLALDPMRFGAPRLVGHLAGVIGLAGPYDFYPFDVRESIQAFGGIADPERSQPINLVTQAAPPMLLAHGEKDIIVGPYHTERLARRLRSAGVPVVERHYPRIAHAGTVLALMVPFRWRSREFADIRQFLETIVEGQATAQRAAGAEVSSLS